MQHLIQLPTAYSLTFNSTTDLYILLAKGKGDHWKDLGPWVLGCINTFDWVYTVDPSVYYSISVHSFKSSLGFLVSCECCVSFVRKENKPVVLAEWQLPILSFICMCVFFLHSYYCLTF